MISDAERDEKRALVASQVREVGSSATVTCGCGRKIPIILSYRCYYCGVFLCAKCAGQHFGKTREEYLAEHGDQREYGHERKEAVCQSN